MPRRKKRKEMLFPDYLDELANQKRIAKQAKPVSTLNAAQQARADKFLAKYGKDAMCWYMWEAWDDVWMEPKDTDKKLILKYVQYFISEGADYYDCHYICLLNYVTKNNNAEDIELLISNGADVNTQDDDGFTPLHYAIKNSNIELAELLISNGAIVHDYEEDSPLLYAVQQDNVEIVKMLISIGIDINAKIYDGESLFHYAIKHESTTIIDFLGSLTYEEMNIETKDGENDTFAGFPWELEF